MTGPRWYLGEAHHSVGCTTGDITNYLSRCGSTILTISNAIADTLAQISSISIGECGFTSRRIIGGNLILGRTRCPLTDLDIRTKHTNAIRLADNTTEFHIDSIDRKSVV